MPDPRSIIVVLVTLSATIYNTASLYFIGVCSAVVLCLLFSAGPVNGEAVYWKWLAVYVGCFLGFGAAVTFLPLIWNSVFAAFVVIFFNWMWRFTVIAGMGAYAVAVIRPAVLSAALSRIHIPQAFTIPLSVALRILPVIVTEIKAIFEAMKLRGIRGFSFRAAQYFTIPLVSTVARSGDELAAAALVRGLGGSVRPTSIVQIRFRLVDAMLLILAVILVFWKVML